MPAPFLPPISAPTPAPTPADDPMITALFFTERVGFTYQILVTNETDVEYCWALEPVSEQHVLDLEREAFLSLCGIPKTQARMEALLKTGKPLRN